MFIDVNEIRGEGLVFDEPLRVPPLLGIADETILVERARVRGTARRGERGADLEGSLRATVRMPCSRCNESFEIGLSVEFFLVLVAGEERPGSGAQGAEEEDAALYHAPDGRADLVDICSEQIYLNLPLKPVCSSGCKGLCPRCGANRNRTECGCGEECADPRLAPLLRFRKPQ